jgi:thioredoxin 1
MPSLILNHQNRQLLSASLTDDTWVVACLCAAWCDTCNGYRAGFDAWSARHPDKCFVWIDIEDQADIMGDIDVDNFPTLLIQRGNTVAFFGTVQPDHGLAERLLMAQVAQMDAADAKSHVPASIEQEMWQKNHNLRILLSSVSSSASDSA